MPIEHTDDGDNRIYAPSQHFPRPLSLGRVENLGGSCRGPGVETGVEAGFGVIGRPVFVVCGPGFEAAVFVSLADSLGVGRLVKLGSC